MDKPYTLHQLIQIIDSWRETEHINNSGDIVFQNEETFTNVKFGSNSLHEIQKHSRGFEQLAETIKEPDEIWMRWEDEVKQKVVLRNYIRAGASCYIVQTRDGIIVDAFAVSRTNCDKYRKGLI